MYPELMVVPMREELVRAGIKETRTAEEVDAALAEPGTTLLVVNSICGCAAGRMRPAVRMALQHSARPQKMFTVFAGQDVAAPNAPAVTSPAIRPLRLPSPSCVTASCFTCCSVATSNTATPLTLPPN